MHTHMCADMCVDMCTATCMDVHVDMRIDKCADICVHIVLLEMCSQRMVYRHLPEGACGSTDDAAHNREAHK